MVRAGLILYKVANNLQEWPMSETYTDRDLSVTATRPGLVLRRREAAGPSAPVIIIRPSISQRMVTGRQTGPKGLQLTSASPAAPCYAAGERGQLLLW